MSGERPIADRVRAGDRLAAARLISWAEDGDPRFASAMGALYAHVGRAWRIGVTGPPGAGKSTLVNELVRLERAAGRRVGVLAVDPSSPRSGGALLGDRIRMEERTSDSGVFIRSMASRGCHGGLARAAVDACDVMDAFGFDELVLETVGVGQAEHDVVAAADTVLVVSCPGAGDGIQAMKAGILEVADVLVVNKADLPGAERLALDLEEASHVRESNTRVAREDWHVPVVTCSAGKGEGVEDVRAAIEQHRAHLCAGGEAGERLARARGAKRETHVRRMVEERLLGRLWAETDLAARARGLLGAGRAPYDVAEELLAAILPAAGARTGDRTA